MKQHVYYLN